jgi:hypothetical protein
MQSREMWVLKAGNILVEDIGAAVAEPQVRQLVDTAPGSHELGQPGHFLISLSGSPDFISPGCTVCMLMDGNSSSMPFT